MKIRHIRALVKLGFGAPTHELRREQRLLVTRVATVWNDLPMNTVREMEKLLLQMSRAEKAELLRLVVRNLCDAFPGIESTPGVSGGEPRIVRTRIPVWALEQARRLGA